MNSRILPKAFLIVLMSFLTALAPKLVAQQSGIDFKTEEYSNAILSIIEYSSGKLNRDEIIEILTDQFDEPSPFSDNPVHSSGFFYLIPEICLVAYDGSENAGFEYVLWNTFETDTIYFDFKDTPGWVDTTSLNINYDQQQISLAVTPNPNFFARSASFTASIITDDQLYTFTAYILQSPAPQPFIFVSPNYLAVLQAGETTPSFTVTHFNLEEGWEAMFWVGWISVDSTTLSSNSISFEIDANTTGNPRLAQIEIRAIGNPMVKDNITILQYASELSFLVVSPKNNYIDSDGGNVEVLVFTNMYNWEAQIIENPGDMITGMVNDPGSITLSIAIAPNLTTTPRIGKIVVSGGRNLLSDTIRIYQSSPFMILSPREKLVSCTGESFGVDVINSGGDIVVSGNPEWVTVNVIGNDSLHVVVDENTADFPRITVVNVSSSTNPAISDELQIIQYSCVQPYVILSPGHQVAAWNDITLPNPFTITSNNTGELSVSASDSWLEATIDGDSVFVTLEINTTNVTRTAEITVFDIYNPSLSDNVTVIQGGTQSFILVSPGFQTISHAGGLTDPYTVFSFNVEDWEVHFESIPPWIIDTQIIGNQVIFNLAANDTPDLRQATFRVRDVSNPELYDEAIILQEAATESLLFLTPRHKQLPHTANPLVNFQVTSLNVELWIADPVSVPEWITVNSSDQITLSLNVAENTLPETRSAIIRIFDTSNPDLNDSVFIFQYSAQNSYLLAAPREQWVSHQGNDDLHFLITAVNVENWEVDLDGIDWITQNASDPDTLSLNVSENTLPETRSALIFLYDTSNPVVKDSVFVYQYSAMDGYLLAAPREQIISHQGSSNVEFQITRVNVDEWEYDPATMPTWISVTNSGEELLALSIAPNESMQIRQATIRIFATDQSNIEDFVSIYQLAGTDAYLIASPRARLVPHYGDDEVDFTITRVNVEGWEFTNTAPYEDWIIFQNIGDTIMRLSVAENTQALSREARIVIQASDDASIKDSVNVYQYSALDGYLLAAPREQIISHQGNSNVEFQVTAVNVDEWDVDAASIPLWISVVNSGEEVLAFSVAPNNNNLIRQATIRIYAVNQPAIEDFVTIYQLAGTEAYLIASPRNSLVPHYGDDEVDFMITRVNVEGWEFTNTAPYEDWIIFQNIGDTIMRLSIAENTQALSREARIVIQASDDASIKDSVNVYQYSALDSYIIVEPREQQTSDYLADTLTFSVIPINVTSLNFEVYYSSHPEMIDPELSGLSDNQLTILVNQNNSQQPREARIKVFDADNPEVSDTVFVYQSYAYIIISPGALNNISWAGEIIKIKSFSNISGYFSTKGHGYEWYELSKDAVNWSDDPVLLSGNDSVYLRVQENNNAFQNRSSFLNFQTGGEIFNIFWFTQNAQVGASYTVSGRVLIEGNEDQPLAGVQIVLYDSIIITNALGRYQHDNVPENWTGTITPIIDNSLPIPYYFFPQIIEISGAGITGNTVLQDIAAYRIEPNVVISPKTTAICNGIVLEPGNLGYPSASISNTFGPSTYYWTSEPVDSVLLENPNILYPNFGPKHTTTYWLEVNNFFRTAVDSFTIVVNQLPASVDFNGSLTVCSKQAGVVYQVIDPPPGVYYSWKLDSENPGAHFANSHSQNSVAGNIAIINWGSNPGNFNLSLIAYNASDCAADPVTKTIEVTATVATPPTTVSRKSDDNMLFATDTLASSYQWGWFVKNESGELMQEYIIPDKNDWYCRLPVGHIYNPLLYHYFVITYNEDGSCGSRSFHNVPVGFEEAERDALTIYPNPNSGVFILRLNNANNMHNGILEVYDNMGQMVLTRDMKSAGNEQIIDLRNRGRATPGVYMVLLRTSRAVISSKIIVQ